MSSEEGNGKEKAAIPKFSSFKPKASPPARAGKDHSGGSRDEDTLRRPKSPRRIADRSKHSTHRKHRNHSKDCHRHQSSHDYQHEHKSADKSLVAHAQDILQDDAGLYWVDKKGDKFNVIYGSQHQYDVPQFCRFGSGVVLGLPSTLRIERGSEDGKSLVIRASAWAPGPGDARRSRNSLWRQTSRTTKLRRIRQDSHGAAAADLQGDFLPLRLHGSSKRRRLRGPVSVHDMLDESVPDYRSIEGRAKPEVDSDLTSESDSESDSEIPRKRNAELDRLVSNRPDDVDAWLEFINHQENLVGRVDGEGHRVLTAAEIRGVADIKLSLYEKALRSVPPHAARARILIGIMEEGSKVWDSKTLSTKWKDILQANPGYISLWVQYLNFQQTQFLTFTYEECKSRFVECLKLNTSYDTSENRQVVNIYILLRLSLLMMEAGFAEHAISLWQAVLEFNVCRPNQIDAVRDSKAAMLSFAEFWESEVPRIGEVGAKGWDGMNNRPMPPRCDPQHEFNIGKRAVFEAWTQQEEACSLISRLPARTLDEVNGDDPYRVILFSDIADFLIPFYEPGLLKLLIGSFLMFCRLPPLASLNNTESLSRWRGDPFVCNSLLRQADELVLTWFSCQLSNEDSPEHDPPLKFPLHNYVDTADTLFGEGSAWFSSLHSWKIAYGRDDAPIDNQLVRQTIRQLAERLSDNEELAEYGVALEFCFSPKDAKKYAKNLLRKRSSSIRLYNTYAILEARTGQLSAAEKVWMTTVKMNNKFSEESRADCILLWRTWVWELLENGQKTKALRLLLSLPGQNLDRDEFLSDLENDPPASIAEFLKAQRVSRNSPEDEVQFTNALSSGWRTSKVMR